MSNKLVDLDFSRDDPNLVAGSSSAVLDNLMARVRRTREGAS